MHNGPVWFDVKVVLKCTVAILTVAACTGAAMAQSVSANDALQHVNNDESGTNDARRSDNDIVVTGTHIKGTESASATYEYTQEDFRRAGQSDLGDVLRSLPYNFSGGQNPGVMQGTIGITNRNDTNGSAPNLRGLGPDATLTLLNGHRLAYDGGGQAVDVSNIPLSAVSSIQIVPDGSSALYGSDAVAGVVNILLKPDFSGFETSARIGGSTDGGGFEQYYDGTAGTTWPTGGLMVSGEYYHRDPITSDQREYTKFMNRPTDILARTNQYSAVLSAHQDLGESVTVSLDGLFVELH